MARKRYTVKPPPEAPPAPGLREAGAVPAPRPATAPSEPLADDLEEEVDRIVAIMAGAERKGEWEPAARISVFAFWGGVVLDFRDAVLLEGETVVDCVAIMGGVEIRVPRDIDVEVEGSGIMGGFSHVSQRTGDPEAPLLRIKGIALMGGVEVKSPKANKKQR